MTARALLAEARRSLAVARQRTLLALVGITVGIGSVIAMVSIGASAQGEAERQFRELGTDLFTVALTSGSSRQGRGRALAALEQLPESARVESIAPVAMPGTPARYRGRALEGSEMLGVGESFWAAARVSVAHGRRLSGLDHDRRFCVIGHDLAEPIRAAMGDAVPSADAEAAPLGQRLAIGDRIYTVVGVLAPAARSRLLPFALDTAVLVPLEIGLRAAAAEPNFAIGRMGPTRDFRAVVARVQQSLGSFGFDPHVETTEELLEQMERQARLFTLLLGAIAAISLVVGGVGVMNVMLSSLSERRREIGLRRALGAERRDIQRQFLLEALLLGIAGGILGVALGVGAGYAVSRHSGWAFDLSESGVLLGVTMSAVVGCFFGYFPARQAANIPPMLVLRSGD